MRTLATVVLVLLLAGCVQPTHRATSATTSSLPTDPSAQVLRAARPTNLTLQAGEDATWWSMGVAAAADGGVAGFRWTIPQGAFHQYRDFKDLSEMVLEAGPILPTGGNVTGWSLEVFRFDEGKAYLAGTYLSMPWHARTYLTPALTTDSSGGADGHPFWLSFEQFDSSDNGLQPGDQLGFVLTATGSGTLGLALHLLDATPDYGSAPPKATKDLLASLQGPGAPLTAVGSGQGMQLSSYAEIAFSLELYAPGGLIGVREWTDSATTQESLATDAAWPLATTHDLQLGSSFKSDGWGYGAFELFGEGGAGTAKVDTVVQGHRVSGTLPYVGDPELGLSAYYLVSGDGQGGTTASVHLQAVDDDSFEIMEFVHLDLGVSLATLLGTPAVAFQSQPLLASGAQHPQLQGDDLVLPGSAPIVLHGWGTALRGNAP